MKVQSVALMWLLVCALGLSNQVKASLPACTNTQADYDGDGYGWENNASCRVSHASAQSDKAVLVNIMQPTSPDNIISITWPHIQEQSPFSRTPLFYEVWNNERLMATVNTNRFLLKLSELENQVGCFSIRAVRGSLKSEHSSPVCFFVRS